MGNLSYVAGLEAFAKAAAETLGPDVFQEVLGLARMSHGLGGHSHEWANLERALTLLNEHRQFVKSPLCARAHGVSEGAISRALAFSHECRYG